METINVIMLNNGNNRELLDRIQIMGVSAQDLGTVRLGVNLDVDTFCISYEKYKHNDNRMPFINVSGNIESINLDAIGLSKPATLSDTTRLSYRYELNAEEITTLVNNKGFYSEAFNNKVPNYFNNYFLKSVCEGNVKLVDLTLDNERVPLLFLEVDESKTINLSKNMLDGISWVDKFDELETFSAPDLDNGISDEHYIVAARDIRYNFFNKLKSHSGIDDYLNDMLKSNEKDAPHVDNAKDTQHVASNDVSETIVNDLDINPFNNYIPSKEVENNQVESNDTTFDTTVDIEPEVEVDITMIKDELSDEFIDSVDEDDSLSFKDELDAIELEVDELEIDELEAIEAELAEVEKLSAKYDSMLETLRESNANDIDDSLNYDINTDLTGNIDNIIAEQNAKSDMPSLDSEDEPTDTDDNFNEQFDKALDAEASRVPDYNKSASVMSTINMEGMQNRF